MKLERPLYCLSFDVEFTKDIKALPQVLYTLDHYNIKASFACIGKWIEQYPEIHHELIARGHEILNHTYHHPYHLEFGSKKYFYEISPQEQKNEIRKCDEVCQKILRYKPIGFRTPHFGIAHREEVYRILPEFGYHYSSSTVDVQCKNFGVPFRHQSTILEIPMGCSSRYPLLLLDSWSALESENPLFPNPELFIAEFVSTIKMCKEENSFLSHYFDPAVFSNTHLLERMLQTLNGIQTLTYREFIETYGARI